MDEITVADFLRFRADELVDPEDADFLFNLASECEEIDSALVEYEARRMAMRWSEHPDFRQEWRVSA